MANVEASNLRTISETLQIESSLDEATKKTGNGKSAYKDATNRSSQRIIKTICIYIVICALVSEKKLIYLGIEMTLCEMCALLIMEHL